jgi:hypothetical protein
MTPLADALTRVLLASARRRAALARRLGMGDTELLALHFLEAEQRLTPTSLGIRLGLTSGGTTALLHRLERAGHVTRESNPADRRSRILRPGDRASDWPRMLAADVESLAVDLTDADRTALTTFLTAVARADEHDAAELAREHATPTSRAGLPAPGLWG